ncbi:hypothetical protein LX81_01297 [Palleronia aestuarii]|uniref:DUF1127 domain-containing protein n=1 Tax=Palleronia aestuarii TaxID=568105 RepID=A0A2W7P2A6_9RHOB|nr:hypothetical protein [Palleronia aestuarii]PZX17572.1 hypothetical protein LX81_01297 [Palleronia aestuarii]
MNFLKTLGEAARKRNAYLRTRHALRTLPLDTALDLDIYPGDADRIARRSVYGA